MFKHTVMSRLYGSSKECHDEYTLEQVQAFNTEADKFKEFIINNVKPTEQKRVHIWISAEDFRALLVISE